MRALLTSSASDYFRAAVNTQLLFYWQGGAVFPGAPTDTDRENQTLTHFCLFLRHELHMILSD